MSLAEMSIIAKQAIYILAFIIMLYVFLAFILGGSSTKSSPRTALLVSVEELSDNPKYHGKVTSGKVVHGGKLVFRPAGVGELAWIDYDAVTNSIWVRLKVPRDPEIVL